MSKASDYIKEYKAWSMSEPSCQYETLPCGHKGHSEGWLSWQKNRPKTLAFTDKQERVRASVCEWSGDNQEMEISAADYEGGPTTVSCDVALKLAHWIIDTFGEPSPTEGVEGENDKNNLGAGPDHA